MASIYKRRNKSGDIVYYGAIRVNGELIRRKLGISLKSAKRQLKKSAKSILLASAFGWIYSRLLPS